MKFLLAIVVLVTVNLAPAHATSEARRKIRAWAKRMEKVEAVAAPAPQPQPQAKVPAAPVETPAK